MYPQVALTEQELLQAAIMGCLWHASSEKAGLRPAHGCTEDWVWQRDIEGAIGEKAFAKYGGLYWGADLWNFKGPDVGPYHVRCRWNSSWQLLVRKGDPDEGAFVLVRFVAVQQSMAKGTRRGLVTQHQWVFEVCGWIYAGDAKRREWWAGEGHAIRAGGRPGCYLVPDEALKPMEEHPDWRQL